MITRIGEGPLYSRHEPLTWVKQNRALYLGCGVVEIKFTVGDSVPYLQRSICRLQGEYSACKMRGSVFEVPGSGSGSGSGGSDEH